jgi:hypothetical protein
MTGPTCAYCGHFVEDDPRTTAAGRPVCDLICAKRFLRETPARILYQRASELAS